MAATKMEDSQKTPWMHRGDRALTEAHVAKGKNAAVSSTNHRLEHISHCPGADLSLGRNP